MGCLKKIIQSIILCFAIIGFISIGGSDFVKTKWDEFHANDKIKTEKRANSLGDFSKIGEEFEISKSASMFGYKGVIAEHKSSGQKMVILDSKNSDILTPEDIKNNKTDEKISQLTKKFRYSAIKIQEIKYGDKGHMTVYGKSVPYIKFSAKITKLPFGDVDGIISAYKEEKDNRILISLNEKNKYSQLIAEEFYKKINK